MRLRVNDLSGATQSAVRTTRRLGGYVAGADYATGAKAGDSRLDASRARRRTSRRRSRSFTDLGTILSQHISVADLQAGARPARRTDRRRPQARRARGESEAAARLERDSCAAATALVREGTYAQASRSS